MRALEATAAEALRLANLRYETGVDSFLQVQSAEVNLYSVQQAFLQVGMESLLNRVALYKALGGGWLEDSAQNIQVEGPGSVPGKGRVPAKWGATYWPARSSRPCPKGAKLLKSAKKPIIRVLEC